MDLTAVMAAIHEFFVGLGVDEIRRRGAADDKPLRMVKTLLHELCKHEVRTLNLTQTLTLTLPLPYTTACREFPRGAVRSRAAAEAARLARRAPASGSTWAPSLLTASRRPSLTHTSAACVQGAGIRQHMGAIPADCEPAPIIHAYVDLNVQTLASAGLIAAPARAANGHASGIHEQVAWSERFSVLLIG